MRRDDLAVLLLAIVWGLLHVDSCDPLQRPSRRELRIPRDRHVVDEGSRRIESHPKQVGPLDPVSDHLGARGLDSSHDDTVLRTPTSNISDHALHAHAIKGLASSASHPRFHDLERADLTVSTSGVTAEPALKRRDVGQSKSLHRGCVGRDDVIDHRARFAFLPRARRELRPECRDKSIEVGSEKGFHWRWVPQYCAVR